MKLIALAPAVAALATALPSAAEVQTFTIDPAHTRPTYEVMHLGYSLQRGRFNKTSGKITFDTTAKQGSADVTIDATSIDSGVPKLDEITASVGEDRVVWFASAPKAAEVVRAAERCAR